MFLFLKNQKNKEGLEKLLTTRPEMRRLSGDTYDFLAEYMNEPELLGLKGKAEKEEENDMWDVLRELMKDERMEGKIEGRLEGKEEGKLEGEDSFANLTQKLLADLRTEDLHRAIEDRAYRKVLYEEYSI